MTYTIKTSVIYIKAFDDQPVYGGRLLFPDVQLVDATATVSHTLTQGDEVTVSLEVTGRAKVKRGWSKRVNPVYLSDEQRTEILAIMAVETGNLRLRAEAFKGEYDETAD